MNGKATTGSETFPIDWPFWVKWVLLANTGGWVVCWVFIPIAITLTGALTGFTLIWLLQQPRSEPQHRAAKAPYPPAPVADQTPAWLQAIRAGRPLPSRSRSSAGLFSKGPTFKQTIQTWQQVIFNPGLPTFQAEKSKADLVTALVWMGAVGLINGLVFILVSLLSYFLLVNTFLPTLMQSLFGGFVTFATIFNGVATVLMAPVSLLIISIILLIIARLFGGEGDFQA
jgi:hypothetical protein